MNLKHTFLIASEGLQTNKSRSGLTILGIVIGITAIIIIMAVGSGAEQLIVSEVSVGGAELIVVRPVSSLKDRQILQIPCLQIR